VIFVDSNIPMYLVGAMHPNKDIAQRLLEQCITRGERLVADAEVLQEILHRYVAINRRDAIQPAFDALLNIVDQVYPVDATDLQLAKSIVLGVSQISVREAVHVAIMQRYGVEQILSLDTGFDRVASIDRIAL
jgi:predicted nucleic acid-binding protein